jgi:hypothetical protein
VACSSTTRNRARAAWNARTMAAHGSRSQ